MSAREVDDYLAHVAEPHGSTLRKLRADILRIVPDAEECIAYGIPTFKVDGEYLVGFGAFKAHCTLFTYGGGFFERHSIDPGPAHTIVKSGIHFGPEKSVPVTLLRRIIKIRLRENVEKSAARKRH